MPVVTISRGSYSRGKEVAEGVAKRLGYECISRDILVEASDQFNIPEIKLIKALHDAPSILNRFNHGQERYISFIRSAILSHIAMKNVVYHGLAGHFFLQNISHVLKIRINAKMQNRIHEEVKRENCTEAEARQNLIKDDAERRKWSKHLYGEDPWDSRLYDMVFCVDTLTVDDIIEIISNTVQKKQFQETKESLAELNRRVLLAQIDARLLQVAPQTRFNLVDESTIELAHLDGKLKHDKVYRQQVAGIMKEEFGLENVHYMEPTRPYRGHINTFFNLDLDQ